MPAATQETHVIEETVMTSESAEALLTRATQPKEWVPLSNGRLCLPIPCKKRRVYLAADGKTRLCEHGETASAISQYATGARTRPMNSACNCKNADGLTAGRFNKAPVGWPKAPSYHSVLVARGAEEVELPGGRLARRLPPINSGACEAFMLPCGNVRCRHGNSEATLRSIIAKGTAHRRCACCCVLGGHSWRRGRLQTIHTQRAF